MMKFEPLDAIRPKCVKADGTIYDGDPIPYQPVTRHFGVAPRLNLRGDTLKPDFGRWSIYHHLGAAMAGEFPTRKSAAMALIRMQQSAEFQELIRVVDADPDSLQYPAVDVTKISKQIQELVEKAS